MLRLPFLATALLLALPTAAAAHGLTGEAADKSTLEFVPLGIEHMLLGWDHLLFICGVVLLAGRFDRAVKLISTFVAGHSFTLILASLSDWRVSPTAVDVVIALSVVCVGALGLRGRPDDWRPVYAMVGGFGLIHGFGLATRLLDLGLPDDGILAKVIAFNVGLEIGQVAAIAIFMGVVYGATKLLTEQWPGVRRAAFGAMLAAGLVAAAVLSFPDGDDGVQPVAGGLSSEGGAACEQADVRPELGLGGTHPPKRWYGPDEAPPVTDFAHVLGDGYAIVRYSPKLSDSELEQLRTIVADPSGMAVGGVDPNQTESVIVSTAQRQLTCERFDATGIQRFVTTWVDDVRSGRVG